MQVDRRCWTSSPCHARHWVCEGLDVVEPAQTERRQDTVHLARNKPLLGRASGQFHSRKWRCKQPGNLFWSWTTHGAPRWTSSAKSVTFICDVWERFAGRVTKEFLLTLVHAFVTSCVDHCNGVLYGSSGYLLDRLQSVLNSAARLILGVSKFDSISAAIRDELHWLPIRKRIQFKIALLVRHCIVGAAPEYMIELCRPVSSFSGRQSLRSASRGDLVVPRFRLQRSGYRAFAVSGPRMWNSLPTEISQLSNNLLPVQE